MESKLATTIAVIVMVAAVGTMTTAVNAFAKSDNSDDQSDNSDDQKVPGSDVPRSQLEKNCFSGNNLACNALRGHPGSTTIQVPGEPPLGGNIQFANPNR